MTAAVLLPGSALARIERGLWLVDCAGPYCSSALTLGPDLVVNDQTLRHGMAWGQNWMQCWDCGFTTTPIHWPADPVGIELILSYRPDPRTRNWNPDETLEDLLTENVAHGLLPPDMDSSEPYCVAMRTAGGVITGGVLLDALPDAGRRRAIGGGN